MRLLLKPILIACTLLITAGNLGAYNISPWFRLAAGVPFETVQRRAFTMEHLLRTSAAFSKPRLGNPSHLAVKTTPGNWLAHKLYYSNTVSKMEKDILKADDTNLFAISAKLQFFYDRDLMLAKALPSTGPDQWNDDDREQGQLP